MAAATTPCGFERHRRADSPARKRLFSLKESTSSLTGLCQVEERHSSQCRDQPRITAERPAAGDGKIGSPSTRRRCPRPAAVTRRPRRASRRLVGRFKGDRKCQRLDRSAERAAKQTECREGARKPSECQKGDRSKRSASGAKKKRSATRDKRSARRGLTQPECQRPPSECQCPMTVLVFYRSLLG